MLLLLAVSKKKYYNIYYAKILSSFQPQSLKLRLQISFACFLFSKYIEVHSYEKVVSSSSNALRHATFTVLCRRADY